MSDACEHKLMPAHLSTPRIDVCKLCGEKFVIVVGEDITQNEEDD
tara:strand:+ start:2128 stop:2262 length:135 start_codon:yes stop_codon:yes gene_type:complete